MATCLSWITSSSVPIGLSLANVTKSLTATNAKRQFSNTSPSSGLDRTEDLLRAFYGEAGILTRQDRRRLAKLMGLLGSDYAGERDAVTWKPTLLKPDARNKD
jgi:hypothetical protein